MGRLRAFLGLGTLSGLLSLVVASLALATALAASVTSTSGTLGAAEVSTPRCTAAGLTVLQNLSSSNVVSVTVGNLPSTCGSVTIQVAVNNGTTSSSGSATVPAAGGSVTVTLAASVAVAAAETTDLVIVGP